MGNFISDLKNNFRRGNISLQLIYINVGIFVVTTLISVFLMLFNWDATSWLQYLELPAWLPLFLKQPWSLVTYMFLHAGALHLLFNMLWLYWFGQLFLSLYSARHFRGLYILGGLCGGLLYMLAYNVFPYFTHQCFALFLPLRFFPFGSFSICFGHCGSYCRPFSGISSELYVRWRC